MLNQLFTGTPTSRRQVVLPSTVKAGDVILVGNEPAAVLDNYQANVGGATCLFNGTFLANVTGVSTLSPAANHTINPGDPLYLKGGTLDTATNVTTGGTLCADSTGTLFGHLDPSPQGGGPVTSGATAYVGVQI